MSLREGLFFLNWLCQQLYWNWHGSLRNCIEINMSLLIIVLKSTWTSQKLFWNQQCCPQKIAENMAKISFRPYILSTIIVSRYRLLSSSRSPLSTGRRILSGWVSWCTTSLMSETLGIRADWGMISLILDQASFLTVFDIIVFCRSSPYVTGGINCKFTQKWHLLKCDNCYVTFSQKNYQFEIKIFKLIYCCCYCYPKLHWPCWDPYFEECS